MIIPYLSNAYTGFLVNPITTDYPLYVRIGLYLQFLTLGYIPVEEFEGARFCIFGRVSTQEQNRNTDIASRLEPIENLAEDELDGEVVETITKSESGATMDRDSLDEILRMAEEDLIDVLAVRNLDRLSRADPWETIDYLIKLRENEVILYEHPRRFLDWDGLNDFQLIAHEIIFSRQWYERLKEGRKEGVHRELRNERWPFKTHFGYYKLDDDEDDLEDNERNIFVNQDKAPIVKAVFEHFLETKKVSEAKKKVNEDYAEELDEELSWGRVRTILISKLCVGKLAYEGEVINEISDLAVVDEDTFEEAQSILDSKSRGDPQKFPEPVIDLTTTFGIEFAHSLFEQISFRKCKECGGELEPYTRTEVWGIPVDKVRCTECDYDGSLISAKEFRQVHQTVPLTCPFCYRSEEFDVEESPLGIDMHRYECTNCNHQFHTPFGPDAVERYLEHPNLGYKLNYEQESSSDDSSVSDDAPTGQLTLSDV